MSDRIPHPPFFFYHEYLDEEGRFRVSKHTAETEQEARRNHKRAAEFGWVTQHDKPSLSPLMGRGEFGYRAIAPAQIHGRPYRTEIVPSECPPEVSSAVRNLRMGDETALSGVRAADDWNAVLPPPTPARTAAAADTVDTPF